MRHIERIFPYKSADSAEISERATHADKRRIGFNRVEPGDFFKLFADEIFDFLCSLLRSRTVVLKKVCESDRAERKRIEMNEISAVVVYKVCRAAAHFHNQSLGDIHGVDDTLIHEHCLLFRGKNLDFDAASHCDFVKETLLIFCTSDRSRCIRKDFVNLVCVAKTTEHRKRFYRLGNSLRLDETVPIHVLPKPYRFFEFVKDDEIAAVQHVDEHESC